MDSPAQPTLMGSQDQGQETGQSLFHGTGRLALFSPPSRTLLLGYMVRGSSYRCSHTEKPEAPAS